MIHDTDRRQTKEMQAGVGQVSGISLMRKHTAVWPRYSSVQNSRPSSPLDARAVERSRERQWEVKGEAVGGQGRGGGRSRERQSGDKERQ